MGIQNIPEHELARLREKAKEITGSQFDYQSSYTDLLSRRLNGEPLQYIEEYVPFYSIQINVDQRCLIPRPETEYMIEIIKNNVIAPKKILDVGTGSGCIALMMKKLFPDSEVHAVDISNDAITLAKENAEINNLEVDFYQSDLLSNVEKLDFDLIVANLPYIPTSNLPTLQKEVIDYEPLIALDGGEDGLFYINKLLDNLKNTDSNDLLLVLEVDTSHAQSLLDSFTDWKDVKLEKDLVERDRYIVARK
ncbi:peptide chain release factor N(5)-glutamine methyltransferase [Acidimicrobiaceae bacterium]|nr:peptide chain release factor N(5)-glutamine methyltransferase [Acidimicrobiaceae bacterium]